VSRKHRRENHDHSPPPQSPPPPPPQQRPAGSSRPWLVLAVVLGLGILVAGGVILTLAVSRGSGEVAVVFIDTSEGTVKAELYPDKAPITVKNFLAYVDEKYFDGTVWHRVVPGFMIQGGGFEPGMKAEKTGLYSAIKNESYNGLKNERGTLAMARTPHPDSATAQFYINLKHNSFLDRANAQDGVGYAVFGKVIEGMDVVDRIAKVPTDLKEPPGGTPLQDVFIKSIRRVETKKAP
jgi:cyclophilin family peptidyl-prolyl cis-trans isomerase